jgi:hypothetical protein
MRRPSRRISRLLGFTVVPVSLVATGLFVTASSYSVFNAQTSNNSNAWNAGSIALVNDGGAGGATSATTGAAFTTGTTDNLKPGTTGTKCMVVQYTGNTGITAAVNLYASGTPTDTGLGSGINLTITSGTGTCASFTNSTSPGDVWSGTLAGFIAKNAYTNAANAPWTVTGTGSAQTKLYKFTWTFPNSGTTPANIATDNAYQGKAVSNVNLTWEAQTS